MLPPGPEDPELRFDAEGALDTEKSPAAMALLGDFTLGDETDESLVGGSAALSDAGYRVEQAWIPGYQLEVEDGRGKRFARLATPSNLRRLSERCAQAFTMFYWGGLGCREIGVQMGICEGRVRVLLCEARRSLEAAGGTAGA